MLSPMQPADFTPLFEDRDALTLIPIAWSGSHLGRSTSLVGELNG